MSISFILETTKTLQTNNESESDGFKVWERQRKHPILCPKCNKQF